MRAKDFQTQTLQQTNRKLLSVFEISSKLC